MQYYQPPGDTESETCTLVLTDSGDIQLAEFIEELVYVRILDSYSCILHADLDEQGWFARLDTPFRRLDMDGYSTLVGKLDGIRQQVYQNLRDLVLIGINGGQIFIKIKGELKPLFGYRRFKRGSHRRYDLFHVKLSYVQFYLP